MSSADLRSSHSISSRLPTADVDRLGSLAQQHSAVDPRQQGLDLGFRYLNELLGGLHAGLFAISGPPSCGKTSFLKQLVDQLSALNKIPTLYVTYLDSATSLRAKSVTRLANIDLPASSHEHADHAILTAVHESTHDRTDHAIESYRRFAHLTHIVEADATTTLSHIEELAQSVMSRARANKVVIAIDALQCMPDADHTRKERLTTELKRLSRTLDCPVLVAVQADRCAYLDNQRPTFRAIHDAWRLEDNADTVCMMWSNRDITRGHSRAVTLYVLKNRLGSLGRLTMLFQPNAAIFSEENLEPINYIDSLTSKHPQGD